MAPFRPQQIVFYSYILLIIAGSFFLWLPFSRKEDISLVDILFTATSAVTVTGLNVVSIRDDFSLIGQVIILLLIQIGGLGYMTLTTFFLVTLGRKIGLRERMILAESLNYPGIYGLVRFLKRTILFVFIVELLGFFVFLILFIPKYGIEKALFYSLFHSISSFNNAGFSIFPQGFYEFNGNMTVNLVTSLLVILGGFGFFTLNDIILYIKGKVRNLSVTTKLVLYTNFILWFSGFVIVLITEYFNPAGTQLWSIKDKIFNALTLSVYTRTAGFSTFDYSLLSESTLLVAIILMFVGASPGGTGGGIKTTTFSVIILSTVSYIRGQKEVIVFNRKISEDTLRKAMVITILSLSYIFSINLLIDIIEEKDFLATLFEVISAFSTVGLSMGNPEGLSFSADFSDLSKVLIIVTMVVGRVGILSFMMAISPREENKHIAYTEAKVLL